MTGQAWTQKEFVEREARRVIAERDSARAERDTLRELNEQQVRDLNALDERIIRLLAQRDAALAVIDALSTAIAGYQASEQ